METFRKLVALIGLNDAARLLDCNRSYLSRVLRGDKALSASLAVRIDALFGELVDIREALRESRPEDRASVIGNRAELMRRLADRMVQA